jgi:molybdopterin converting factor small subunit
VARVHIPALLRVATGGREWVSAEGTTVGEVIADLEDQHPSLTGRLLREGRLVSGLAVAIDGEVSSLGVAELVEDETEIHFVSAIQGGVR